MRPALIATLSAAIFASTISSACMGGVVETDRITLDEGNVTALLESTSQHYVDAMRSLISERYQDEYRAIRWEALENVMRDAPIARLEYHFAVNGVANVRVYHAMGGRPLGSLAKSIFEGPTRPGTPDTPASPMDIESEDEGSVRALPAVDEVAADLEDNRFYTEFDEINVRAPMMADDSSALEAFLVEGENRAFDPEFKALRAIERDLRTGVIPSGGRIQGSVSGMACTSCKYAMKRFSDTYAVDVRLAQVFPSMSRHAQAELIASGRARLRGTMLVDTVTDRPLLAADLLRGAREGQIRRSLSPRAMGRSFKGMPWARRSFRLNPIRLQRVSEGSSEGSPPPRPRVPKDPATGC
ncbi:hypothetical protein [Luteibacter sp. dw_328]|uniref:hypothetical protein n=1 Tax=Luteibacter sp. dw_328 TaxID=2719796 RepID=UPI001BD477A9|nr:hypothetical protein [Luteibacter sp. dw_328]